MKIKLIFYFIIPIIYWLFVYFSIYALFYTIGLNIWFSCDTFLSNTNECMNRNSGSDNFSIFLFFLYFVFPVWFLFITIWVFVIKFINNKYKKSQKSKEEGL